VTLPSLYVDLFFCVNLRWSQQLRADSRLSVQTTFLDYALMHLLVRLHRVCHTRIAANHLAMQENNVDHLLLITLSFTVRGRMSARTLACRVTL
jgi:hypothetical protein